jgi:hypothetical protein
MDWTVFKVCSTPFLPLLLPGFAHLFGQWNTPSIGFYEKALGAKGMDEWRGMRLEEDGIRALSQIASPRIGL